MSRFVAAVSRLNRDGGTLAVSLLAVVIADAVVLGVTYALTFERGSNPS